MAELHKKILNVYKTVLEGLSLNGGESNVNRILYFKPNMIEGLHSLPQILVSGEGVVQNIGGPEFGEVIVSRSKVYRYTQGDIDWDYAGRSASIRTFDLSGDE